MAHGLEVMESDPCVSRQLEDSDDEQDDEFLSQPVFSQESKCESVSDSPNPSMIQPTTPTSASTVAHGIVSDTKAEEEEYNEKVISRAISKARFVSTSMVDDIRDLSLLKWVKCKNAFYPCCIRKNHDEALELAFLTSKNDTLIRLLGYKRADAGKLMAVPRSSLRPYDFDDGTNKEEESRKKKTHNTDCNSPIVNGTEAAECTPDESSMMDTGGKDGGVSAVDPDVGCRWSSRLMDRFVKKLKQQSSLSPVDTLVEKLALERFMERVVENQKGEQASSFKRALSLNSEMPRQKKARRSTVKGDSCSENSEIENCVDKENIDVKVSATRVPTSVDLLFPVKDLTHVKRPKLRAGDVVQYYTPVAVPGRDPPVESTVVVVQRKRKGGGKIFLELANGALLSSDEKVLVVKQMQLKGGETSKLPVKNSWRPISSYALDDSNNSLFKDPRFVDQIGKLFAKQRAELQKATESFYGFQREVSEQSGENGTEAGLRNKNHDSDSDESSCLRRTKDDDDFGFRPVAAVYRTPPNDSNHNSPKTATTDVKKEVRKQSKLEMWKSSLDGLLKKAVQRESQRRSRRGDQTQQLHYLKFAINAANQLVPIVDILGDVETALLRLEEDTGEPIDRFESFFSGNVNNLLTHEKIQRITSALTEWLSLSAPEHGEGLPVDSKQASQSSKK